VVRDWPPITEPELLERLALDQEGFIDYFQRILGAGGARDYEPAVYERAIGYPWERPAGSYILRDEEVELLEDLDPAARGSAVEAFAENRHPILAFGGNGAPSWLARKCAHFVEPADREALVLTGYLHDVDVGVAPAPSIFGYMPAALFASPGTAVRAAVLWLTPAQVTQLTWSEIGYWLGRLEEARFEMDEADFQVDESFAYVHRFGALCVEDAPVALAAIPAKGRAAVAMTQAELLDLVAAPLLGDGAVGEDLVRALFEDPAGVFARASATWPSAQQLRSRWSAFPAAARLDMGLPR
jgi:hypothetical protein